MIATFGTYTVLHSSTQFSRDFFLAPSHVEKSLANYAQLCKLCGRMFAGGVHV